MYTPHKIWSSRKKFAVVMAIVAVSWVYLQFDSSPAASSEPIIEKSADGNIHRKGWSLASNSPFGNGPSADSIQISDDSPPSPELAAKLEFYKTARLLRCVNQKEYETSIGAASSTSEECSETSDTDLKKAEEALRQRAAEGHLDAALEISLRNQHKYLLNAEARVKQEAEAYEKDGTLPERYANLAKDGTTAPAAAPSFTVDEATLISQLKAHLPSGNPDVFSSLSRIYASKAELPDNKTSALAFQTVFEMQSVSPPTTKITNELIVNIPISQKGEVITKIDSIIAACCTASKR